MTTARKQKTLREKKDQENQPETKIQWENNNAPAGSHQNSKLNQEDLASLARSFIPEKLAQEAGLHRLTSATSARLLGRKDRGGYSGIAFPYYWPDEDKPRSIRVRLDKPWIEKKAEGQPSKEIRYLGKVGTSNYFYLPPGITKKMLNNIDLPVVLTEGEKKTLALWRLATEGQNQPRFLPIGISGVWFWKGAKPVKGPIQDFERVTWSWRTVYILFDSDKNRNSHIKAAESGLGCELLRRNATVNTISLPDLRDFDKTGADDFLAHPEGGPSKMLELIDQAKGLTLILDPSDPLPSARLFVQQHYMENGDRTLIYQSGVFYRFHGHGFSELEDEFIEKDLYRFLEVASVLRTTQKGTWMESFKPTIYKNREIMAAIKKSITLLPSSDAPPCWLEGEHPDYDPQDIVCCKNGLLYIPKRILLPPTPRLFALNALDIEFNPQESEPKNWLMFLNDQWEDDFPLIRSCWRVGRGAFAIEKAA